MPNQRVNREIMLRSGAKLFDWYVDSVNGNNARDGRSEATAKQTLAAVPALTYGMRLGMARGSTWLEEIVLSAHAVRIGAYGVGAAPRLDCRDPIAAGDWSATGGTVNVYDAAVAPNSAAACWVGVWEDGTRMARATSVANCDATPGSYFPSSDVLTPITLYVHASDSSDPGVNGKVYSFTKRKTGIDGVVNHCFNVVVDGIHTIANLSESGSLRLDRYAVVRNCIAEHGNKHNVYIGDGSYLYNVLALEAYYNPLVPSKTYFVYNENNPIGIGVIFDGCTARCTVVDDFATGFYGHYNVGGSFGVIQYTNCTVENMGAGFDGGNGTDAILIENPTLTNCSFVVALWKPTTIIGGTFTIRTAFASYQIDGVTLNLSGITFTKIGGFAYFFLNAKANSTLNISNSTFNGAAWSIAIYYQAAGTNFTLSVNGSIFMGHAFQYYEFDDVDYVYTGDHNQFDLAAGGFYYAGSWHSLVQWQAFSGQDANSIGI